MLFSHEAAHYVVSTPLMPLKAGESANSSSTFSIIIDELNGFGWGPPPVPFQ